LPETPDCRIWLISGRRAGGARKIKSRPHLSGRPRTGLDTLSLEIKPQGQLNDPGMAAKGLIRLIELRRSCLKQTQHRGLRRKLYPVYGSRKELGVIEGIVQIDSELDLLPFTDTEVLEDREVQVVNAWHLERVSTAIGLGSRTRLNVLGIRIVS